MKAAIIILALAATPAIAAKTYICDGSTAKTLADGTMIESTFVTAPNTLTVIDMGESFIVSDLAATAVIASPNLNARGMAFRGNNGFAKDKFGYYVTSPGIINAALNCKPVVKS